MNSSDQRKRKTLAKHSVSRSAPCSVFRRESFDTEAFLASRRASDIISFDTGAILAKTRSSEDNPFDDEVILTSKRSEGSRAGRGGTGQSRAEQNWVKPNSLKPRLGSRPRSALEPGLGPSLRLQLSLNQNEPAQSCEVNAGMKLSSQAPPSCQK